MITVVNCRVKELRKQGYNSLLHFLHNPNHIYVGRKMTFYVEGSEESKWKNPFKVEKDGVDIKESEEKFKNYIRTSKLYDELHELGGKTLACWCFPEPCHATWLQELHDEK